LPVFSHKGPLSELVPFPLPEFRVLARVM